MQAKLRNLRATGTGPNIVTALLHTLTLGVAALLSFHGSAVVVVAAGGSAPTPSAESTRLSTAKMLTEYYQQMSVPKPFVSRSGKDFEAHRTQLRRKVLESTGLWPLPDRIPLDVHQSAPLDHPWCTVRRVFYQLWPQVYSSGLLFIPKELPEQPAPATLCPHGHWKDGNAHAEVQRRCLNFARLGYVTFSSTQNHYEDLAVGVSHQTLMIWNNMRALDYLESLPQVDKTRMGVAGASGGGLQAQMLVALDPRVKAATIVGLTCDFREIMFPDRHHCMCNHFPGVMQFADHPEISALGLTAAVQFLTMNDWTRNFEEHNLPTIRKLYAANGVADRVDCQYYDTPHSYDRPKRERTYWWMEKWVRGIEHVEPLVEPEESEPFPLDTLKRLTAEVSANRGFAEIGSIYRRERGYKAPTPASPADWKRYRHQIAGSLKALLGLDATLPRATAEPQSMARNVEGELIIERTAYPSEGGILVPTIVVRRQDINGRLPVAVVFDAGGKDALLAETAEGSARQLAKDGWLVALPDIRCYGEMFSTGSKNDKLQKQAWERNGIVWGRPVPGMGCTDIRGVLDGLSERNDSDMSQVKAISRNSGGLGIAVLFAAAVDARITSADVDLAGGCFERRNLPLVPCVLQHGDVLQWAALLADRELTLRNVSEQAGDPDWLRAAFAVMGADSRLRIVASADAK